MLENAWLVILVVGSVALMPLLIGNIRREIEWSQSASLNPRHHPKCGITHRGCHPTCRYQAECDARGKARRAWAEQWCNDHIDRQYDDVTEADMVEGIVKGMEAEAEMLGTDPKPAEPEPPILCDHCGETAKSKVIREGYGGKR